MIPAPLVNLLLLETKLSGNPLLLLFSPERLALVIESLECLKLLSILPHSLLIAWLSLLDWQLLILSFFIPLLDITCVIARGLLRLDHLLYFIVAERD